MLPFVAKACSDDNLAFLEHQGAVEIFSSVSWLLFYFSRLNKFWAVIK